MIKTGFEKKVKVQQIIQNQLPEFILDESPKAVEFLKQYYISQEYQGGPSDITENLDQYLNLNNLSQEIIQGKTTLIGDIDNTVEIIELESTKGLPEKYGLIQINDEIITYTGIEGNKLTGCVRGFSGVTSYNDLSNPYSLLFSSTTSSSHKSGTEVKNLSALFFQEVYKKTKSYLTPELENVDFVPELNVSNFLKQSKDFYSVKGTEKSYKILFKILYDANPTILNLNNLLFTPSNSEYSRRRVIVAERISGDPLKLIGQTIFSSRNSDISASVSEVELFTKNNNNYYKIGLFIGYDDDTILADFEITAKTRVIEKVFSGDSIITVDSTIGFDKSGILFCNDNTINYTDKTSTQFLGCTGILNEINVTEDIRNDFYVYGYEYGIEEENKKVELILGGLISEFIPGTSDSLFSEGEQIYVKTFGESIENTEENNFKEIAANSWIYNTSNRFKIYDIQGSTFKLNVSLDKSVLKPGDSVDILFRNSKTIAHQNAIVDSVNRSLSQIVLGNISEFSPNESFEYDIRRNLKKSSSSTIEYQYGGNNKITSDIQNLYSENDDYLYVASNSLPSYEITKTLSIASIPNAEGTTIQGFNGNTAKYSIISFSKDVPFTTGDEIYYKPEVEAIDGLEEGIYFVKVLDNKNQIRLYPSLSFVPTDDYLEFLPLIGKTGRHDFILSNQKNLLLGSSNLLKKFPLNIKLPTENKEKTLPGPVGLLCNGVEILSYKSNERVFYGPLEKVSVLNTGDNYDVINPPKVEIAIPPGGSEAKIQPVVTGSLREIIVDPQDFDIGGVFSASLVGGNGEGAVLDPILREKYREVFFDGRSIVEGGGIDVVDETISFISNHNFIEGQPIVYNSNGNDSIGIGSYKFSNTNQEIYLENEGIYYPKIVNNSTIQLYKNINDLRIGINTVGFTTANNTGFHKFRSYEGKTTLHEIKIISPGSGYENRKLIVKSSNIDSIKSIISFPNHGFSDGDLIDYSAENTAISGLSTSNQYYVLKIDDNQFQLSKTDRIYFNPYEIIGVGATPSQNIFLPNHNFKNNQRVYFGKDFSSAPFSVGTIAGIDDFSLPFIGDEQLLYVIRKTKDHIGLSTVPVGTGVTGLYINDLGTNIDRYYFDVESKSNNKSFDYSRRKPVQFLNSGTGYQYFEYPKISVKLDYFPIGVGTDKRLINSIKITPIVTGGITTCYLYDNGSGYGNQIKNLQIKPRITVKNGKNCKLKPIIVSGEIVKVEIQNKGTEYSSPPILEVIGDGKSAKLRPVINENGNIVDVIVKNKGIGYSSKNTYIKVTPAGSGAIFDSNVRRLTINLRDRYGDEFIVNSQFNDSLNYKQVGYSTEIVGSVFGDKLISHSPIIGWAYDGNPIYGPYGYSDPLDSTSQLKIINSGYSKDSSFVEDRPDEFPLGFFVEDYKFDNSGDLDVYNGRFCITPEFPNGIYAYFATLKVNEQSSKLESQFPYFIGNYYRSSPLIENYLLTQDFDINTVNFKRNTFPYKINDLYSSNDFILGSNFEIDKNARIETVQEGKIDRFEVVSGGSNYKVGDRLIFNNEGTGGGGSSAIVDLILGKDVTEINTSVETYENVEFFRKTNNLVVAKIDPPDRLKNLDTVVISGLSTYIRNLEGAFSVGIKTDLTSIYQNIPENTFLSGIVTDVKLSRISPIVSVGSTVKINDEVCRVLNVFKDEKVIRIRREYYNNTHSLGDRIEIISPFAEISLSGKNFNSELNETVYFNPYQSVGLGTLSGISSSYEYKISDITYNIPINAQSIYIPNHPFKDKQRVILSKPITSSALFVKDTPDGNGFNLPLTGNSQEVFIIKKSNNYIGIVTNLGITTSTNGLYFVNSGSNDFEYSLTTKYTPVTGKIEKITSTVSVSTSHNLRVGDLIDLSVVPNTSVGIGTSTGVRVKYDPELNQILVNPIGFSSSSVDIDNDIINIQNHGFKTGEKIFYDSSSLVISGLETGNYYVYRVDDNRIKLSETSLDLTFENPEFVNLQSVGGSSHVLSWVNPRIDVFKNNNLVFNLDDSSLVGFNFKIYYDNNFSKEFISIESKDSSSSVGVGSMLVGVGTIGISSTASLTLNYSDLLPNKLYYTLEKDGNIIYPEKTVVDYSQISFYGSIYNNKNYRVSNITSTNSFDIDLYKKPEVNNYSLLNSNIKYKTNSQTANGAIENIRLLESGRNYKKLPNIDYIDSDEGTNAIIDIKSNTIGKVLNSNVKIEDPGFDYSIDKTIRPEVYISPSIVITDSSFIRSIDVEYGGANYQSPPNLVLVNSLTRDVVNNGTIVSNILSSSISSVDIIESPRGLSDNNHELVAIDNTNGIKVSSASYFDGIVSLQLYTPISGFDTPPFKIGDKIFVENIVGYSTIPGSGFNSKDYGYRFFTVSNYVDANPAILEYSLSGLTTNPGIPNIVQPIYSSVINENIYPRFTNVQEFDNFLDGEKLLVYNSVEASFIEQDLYISSSDKDNIKIFGSYLPKTGSVLRGKLSGARCTISNIFVNKSRFDIDYKIDTSYGWKSDSGKLNQDYQVLPDNDYYQNLSYTIRSPLTYDEMSGTVSKLLHSSGLKNFADTQIVSESENYIRDSLSQTVQLFDFISEHRVDEINNYDLVTEIDVEDGRSYNLKLKNKRLSDYIECRTNRVLKIDDISSRFNNKEDIILDYTNIAEFPSNQGYLKFLVQIKNPNPDFFTDTQLTEIIVLNDSKNMFTLEKSHLTNSSPRLGEFDGELDGFVGNLKFSPRDPIKEDYDIKILQSSFNSSISGITTTSLGPVKLISSVHSVGIGSTVRIIGGQIDSNQSYHLDIEVIDEETLEKNFVEIYLSHDGVDPIISDYFFNTDENSFSGNFIGSFSPNLNSNILTLEYTNSSDNEVTIKSNIVGFGSTSLGIGTFRFAQTDQIEGTEKTANIIANSSLGTNEVIRFNKFDISTLKSLVRVGCGLTNAIHQIMFVNDGLNLYTKQYPILSIGSTSGIGTFGAEISGNDAILKFYPDNSETCEIISLNEIFFTEIDFLEDYNNLRYGAVDQTYSIAEYSGREGTRSNRSIFDLRTSGDLIFKKVFNPSNAFVLNQQTGTIAIRNHFFNTGEKIKYTPKSTFVGVGTEPLGITTSLIGGVDFIGDIIIGFSTISGVGNTESIYSGQIIRGTNIPLDSVTTVIGVGNTYGYFTGDTNGSNIITGIANTSILSRNDTVKHYNSLVGFGTILSIGIGSITVENSIPVGIGSTYFVERLFGSVTISSVSSASTFRSNYSVGVSTDILPNIVYPIKQNKDIIKLATRREDALSGISVTFTSLGSGNAHELEMEKQGEKTIISIDGIIQSPLTYTSVVHKLTNNVSTSTTYISLSGIGSIRPLSVIKIDDEYVKVIVGGLGEDENGPIVGIGSTLIFVQRGYLGSTPTEHFIDADARLYSGSYLISDSKINFTDVPRGSAGASGRDTSNLLRSSSSFNGRVYLRQNYDSNVVYDDLTYDFTGIGQTYRLKVNGEDYTDVSTGNGILLINQVYQIPTTENNDGNNYEFVLEDGYSNVVFSGIRSEDSDNIIISEDDINQNNLPRGGIVVSLGSTPGLGFAPLVGVPTSMLDVTIGVGGSISSVGFGSTAPIYGSGYRGIVSIGITDSSGSGAVIKAITGAGGSFASFVIEQGGSNYTSPILSVPDPSYSDLPVIGISRNGIGLTEETGKNLLLTLDVEASSSTGIGSTLFQVSSFKISRPGYGFQLGDIIKPVGLVTASHLSEPINEFELVVTDVFSDSFSAWQFGELDYIDSIKNLQNGIRKRFPLYKNGELLSFEKNSTEEDSSLIDLNYLLLILINGIIQEPEVSYEFLGGSSIVFTEAPNENDEVSIYFYRGSDQDSTEVNVVETLKRGDTVLLTDFYDNETENFTQDPRTISDIVSSDLVETNVYFGKNISLDENFYRPLRWTKQKRDLIINGELIYKSRNAIESYVYPTARVIKSFSDNDSEIFVDDISIFKYESEFETIQDIDVLLISEEGNPSPAGATVSISPEGFVSNVSIVDGGSGYLKNEVEIKISSPQSRISSGIATIALAKASVLNGEVVEPVTILNPGLGYSQSSPPQAIIEFPNTPKEVLKNIDLITGFSGIVTGISTSSGTGGNPLAINFYINTDEVQTFDTLKIGYPIYVKDTVFGNGIYSINTSDSDVVGIGTTFIDNIYIVNDISSSANNAKITANILSSSDISGITTFGTIEVGNFSWGRLSGISKRDNPISLNLNGYTISGLGSFPTIQRRKYGFKSSGALKIQYD